MNIVPKVSVWMVTYNHQDYIAQAVESVIMQKTDFTVHLFIGEDFSSDNTRFICQSLKQKYPDQISLFLNEKNLGANKNARNIYKACFNSGAKYIAMLEGDDYWKDPLKLQKQVDYMESNPEFSLIFHNAIVVNEKVEKHTKQNMHENLDKDVFYTQDLLKQWFIPTASILFRNYKDFVLPDWFANCSSGDIALLLLLSLNGPFKYYNEPMSVYRLQQAGISNKHTGYDKVFSMIYLYKCFNFFTNNKFEAEIQNAMIYEIRKHLPNNTKAELKKLKQDLFIKSYLKIKKLF